MKGHMTLPGGSRIVARASRKSILYSRTGGKKYAERCERCGGLGLYYVGKSGTRPRECQPCAGAGWHGLDPTLPTAAPPGSQERVAVYRARLAGGCAEYGLSQPHDAGPEAWADTDHQWQPLSIQWKHVEGINGPQLGDEECEY